MQGSSWRRSFTSIVAASGFLGTSGSAFAAATVRYFDMNNGEDIFGQSPSSGAPVAFIYNTLSEDPLLDLQSPIGAEPVFVGGRTGAAGDFAVHFNGQAQLPGTAPGPDNLVTQLFGKNFCTFCPDADAQAILEAASGGQVSASFSLGHQLWVRPDIAGQGQRQIISMDGGGQWGGIGISENGKWMHIWARRGILQFTETHMDVAWGEWSSLATVVAMGNVNRLYVNGTAANQGIGWYDGSGVPLTIGAAADGYSNAFIGAVDDLKLMITALQVGGFVPQFDLDFFAGQVFSGVPGDINQDGVVDDLDNDIWIQNVGFRNGVGFGDPGTLVRGDANQNGIVDFADLAIIKAAAAHAGTPIPEPGTMALMGLGGLMVIRRRTR